MTDDPRIAALPDSHGHVKGEHKPFAEERPIPYTARMIFLWFYHACRRGAPRFMMVADHVNYLTFEDPAAANLVRRALKLAQAGDLYGAAETAGVDIAHAAVVSEGLRRGMRCTIGAEVDNDPRNRPDAANIVDAMRPDGLLRAIHFLPITHPQHGENWMWAFTNAEFRDLYDVVGVERTWELYVTTLLEAIEKQPGHIVAHFYAPAIFGHWPDDTALERYEDRLVAACAAKGMAIEVNARFLYRYFADDDDARERYLAVNRRLVRKAKEQGVPIAVGSGAHSPKDQGAGFNAILQLLDEAGVNEIAFPLEGRLARVALRVTDHERVPSGYATDRTDEPIAVAAPAAAQASAAVPEAPVPSQPARRPRRERTRKATLSRDDTVPGTSEKPLVHPDGTSGPAPAPRAPAATQQTAKRRSTRAAAAPPAKRTAKAPARKSAASAKRRSAARSATKRPIAVKAPGTRKKTGARKKKTAAGPSARKTRKPAPARAAKRTARKASGKAVKGTPRVKRSVTRKNTTRKKSTTKKKQHRKRR